MKEIKSEVLLLGALIFAKASGLQHVGVLQTKETCKIINVICEITSALCKIAKV